MTVSVLEKSPAAGGEAAKVPAAARRSAVARLAGLATHRPHVGDLHLLFDQRAVRRRRRDRPLGTCEPFGVGSAVLASRPHLQRDRFHAQPGLRRAAVRRVRDADGVGPSDQSQLARHVVVRLGALGLDDHDGSTARDLRDGAGDRLSHRRVQHRGRVTADLRWGPGELGRLQPGFASHACARGARFARRGRGRGPGGAPAGRAQGHDRRQRGHRRDHDELRDGGSADLPHQQHVLLRACGRISRGPRDPAERQPALPVRQRGRDRLGGDRRRRGADLRLAAAHAQAVSGSSSSFSVAAPARPVSQVSGSDGSS